MKPRMIPAISQPRRGERLQTRASPGFQAAVEAEDDIVISAKLSSDRIHMRSRRPAFKTLPASTDRFRGWRSVPPPIAKFVEIHEHAAV